jgi:hypothetical protein
MNTLLGPVGKDGVRGKAHDGEEMEEVGARLGTIHEYAGEYAG